MSEHDPEAGLEEEVEVDQRELVEILSRYPGTFDVLRELIQNADHAEARIVEVHFQTGEVGRFDFSKTNVCKWIIKNDGNSFTEKDWERLGKIADGDDDFTQVGAFGGGFYSVLEKSDRPLVRSNGKSLQFYRGQDGKLRKQFTDCSPDLWTSVELELREPEPSPVLTDLTRFLVSSIALLTNIDTVSVHFDNQRVLHIQKQVQLPVDIPIPEHLIPTTPLQTMTVESIRRTVYFAPKNCFIESDDMKEHYHGIFPFLNFCQHGNSFLESCCAKKSPDASGITRKILQDPQRYLEALGNTDLYLQDLRTIASQLDSISEEDKQAMKEAPMFLAEQNGVVAETLLPAEQVFISDWVGRDFGGNVSVAPEGDTLEKMYLEMGSVFLGTYVRHVVTVGDSAECNPPFNRDQVILRISYFMKARDKNGRTDVLFDDQGSTNELWVKASKSLTLKKTFAPPHGVLADAVGAGTVETDAVQIMAGFEFSEDDESYTLWMVGCSRESVDLRNDIAGALCHVLLKTYGPNDVLLLALLFSLSDNSLERYYCSVIESELSSALDETGDIVDNTMFRSNHDLLLTTEPMDTSDNEFERQVSLSPFLAKLVGARKTWSRRTVVGKETIPAEEGKNIKRAIASWGGSDLNDEALDLDKKVGPKEIAGKKMIPLEDSDIVGDTISQSIVLENIKYFTFLSLPSDLSPPDTIHIDLTQGLSIRDTVARSSWTQLSLLHWLEYACSQARRLALGEESSWDVGYRISRVLIQFALMDDLSPRQWDRVVEFMKDLQCIPTTMGLRSPVDSYFKEADVCESLPVVSVDSFLDIPATPVVDEGGLQFRPVTPEHVCDVLARIRVCRMTEWEDGLGHNLHYLCTQAGDLTTYIIREGRDPFDAGGFADIYRGLLRSNGESIRVAIKAIRTYLTSDGVFTKDQKRLRREIKVWLSLEHINVLPFLGTATGFGRFPAIVCPWVENGPMTRYLQEHYHALPVVEILTLVNDVASGIHYLHSRSVVHGDLSGSNVLIGKSGRAYLSDFGLSTLLTELGGSTFATSFHERGTPRWAAPELLNPHVSEDEKEEPLNFCPKLYSDIYSFGCVMLQILTGKVPYHYLPHSYQVLCAVSTGKTPRRPSCDLVTEDQWTFMQRCWSTVDAANSRPSSEEILDFTKSEIVKINTHSN